MRTVAAIALVAAFIAGLPYSVAVVAIVLLVAIAKLTIDVALDGW